MLVNVKLAYSVSTQMILALIGQGGEHENFETGIYLSNSFNFGNDIIDKNDPYFDFGELSAYGVCDFIEEVKGKYIDYLTDPVNKFCISFTKVKKSEQPSDGGWRWHKWGPYIGDKKPKCEYLYDEGDEIQEVYCYHIYHIKV